MMLQTLVENAIKHGISKLEQGGDIHINTSIQNQQLRIELNNTGSLDTQSKHDHSLGFGLSSSIQRLHHIYGDNASLHIAAQQDTVQVTILINLQHE
jgi:LytS/YehU family sensor histidine kinase